MAGGARVRRATPCASTHSPCLGICLSGVSTSKATNAGVSVSTVRFVCRCVCTCACPRLRVFTGEPLSLCSDRMSGQRLCVLECVHVRAHVCTYDSHRECCSWLVPAHESQFCVLCPTLPSVTSHRSPATGDWKSASAAPQRSLPPEKLAHPGCMCASVRYVYI